MTRVPGVKPYRASGRVRHAYRIVRRDFGMVGPPFRVQSPLPDVLHASAVVHHECYITGRVPRIVKEAVAVTVSRENACGFCAEVHAMLLDAAGVPDALHAVQERREHEIADPRVRDAVQWAAALREPGARVLAEPAFSAEDAPEVIGTALNFHYVNRVADALIGPSFFPPAAARVKDPVTRLMAVAYAPFLRRVRNAHGAAAADLPRADEAPAWLAWARADPAVEAAWTALAGAVDAAAEAHVPRVVQDVVRGHVDEWRGGEPPLSRAWVEDAIAGLEDHDAALARLALLTALASPQVDDGVVDACRTRAGRGREDAPVVAAVTWAALEATRRIASWTRAPGA